MDNATAQAPVSTTTKHVTFRIWRQDGPDKPGHFDEFRVPYGKGANVISCLMEIQRNPVTTDGQQGRPGHLGRRLPRGGVRQLRHEHQRAGPHGLLGADRPHRRSGEPSSPWSR